MKILSIKHRAYAAISSAITASFLMPTMAFAFIKPTEDTELGYSVYNIVHKIITGPFGFSIGVLLVIYAGAKLTSANYFQAFACAIAGTIIIKAEDIAVALGMLIT